MKKENNSILFSLLIMVLAQINVNLYITNFKISIAIIAVPVLLFLVKDAPIRKLAILSGFFVYLSRIFVYWLKHASLDTAPVDFLPEMLFYIAYGFLLYGFYSFWPKPIPLFTFVFSLIFIDYFSNLLELLLRIHDAAFETYAQLSIFMVALIRTLLCGITIYIFDQYRFTLLSREHAERYKRLMLLISRLNGEMIWMEKNTSLMEETMKASYQLYHNLQQTAPGQASLALTVAKDIHEIKKEYYLIMRGISESLQSETRSKNIPVADLFLIVEHAVLQEAKELHKTIDYTYTCDHKLHTDKHYLLLSVFHNLCSNAVEACEKEQVHIRINQTYEQECCIFDVSDDGPGIDASDLEQIFEPGFSTKINYETGSINRGLGLNIVKDIVESTFHGSITVSSKPGNTIFHLSIPLCALEEKQL